MKRLDLHPGDGFLVDTGKPIGKAINYFQAMWSDDKKSVFNHAGIIWNEDGGTLEALGKVCNKNIYTNYKNCKILIYRHRKMTPELFDYAYPIMERHKKDTYPWWRLPLFIIKPVAEHINPSKLLVCSEINAKYLFLCRLKKKYLGVSVDDLHDMVVNKPHTYEIVYEGKLIDNK